MKEKKPVSRYIYIALIIIIIFGILLAVGKNVKRNDTKTMEDALLLGEEKYLEFLWVVDGAFNDSRYNNESFSVNGKKMKDEYKLFSCTYEKNKKTCMATKFEEAFAHLFASNIDYDKVYGDGLSFKWYEEKDGKYYFSNMNTCNASRMSKDQEIKVEEINDNMITYTVSFTDNISTGTYLGNHQYHKKFVLVLEKGEWKVSKAYYHDPCFMDYNLE